MRFVYPSLPYQLRTVYPLWAPEYEWAQAHNLAVGLVDVAEQRRWLPAQLTDPTPVVYRGWMLSAAEYATLERLLPLAVPVAEYLSSHEASGWYEAVAAYTFPSHFLTEPAALDFGGGRQYFVKGLVKSFEAASVVSTQAQLDGFWQKQELPAGTPLFVRDFGALRPGSERRFFVVRGQAFGAGGVELPVALQPALAALRPRLFYAFDVAETLTGQPVLVEVGDGQVSDLKEWSVTEFGDRVLRALANANDNL